MQFGRILFIPSAPVIIDRANRLLEAAGSPMRFYLQSSVNAGEYLSRALRFELPIADGLTSPLHFLHDLNFHLLKAWFKSPEAAKFDLKLFQLRDQLNQMELLVLSQLRPASIPLDQWQQLLAVYKKKSQDNLVSSIDVTSALGRHSDIKDGNLSFLARYEPPQWFFGLTLPQRRSPNGIEGILFENIREVADQVDGLDLAEID